MKQSVPTIGASTATAGAAQTILHSKLDNLQGQLFGVLMIAFGMSILHSLGLIIGQAAGVAFLLSYTTGASFGLAFTLVNLPFYLLAMWRMGRGFTLNTLVAVTAVSLLTNTAGDYIAYRHLDPLVGAILAGLCVGIGLIGLFRHQASCGGISILAAYLQEHTGLKAGWLLMAFDLLLFSSSLWILRPATAAYSLVSALTMNLLVAWNHRKEWYIAK